MKSLAVLLPLAVSAQEDIENSRKWDEKTPLNCDGVNYGGINWGDIRSQLSLYADKYRDRPAVLADYLRSVTQIADQYQLDWHYDNPCVLGDLTLRFFAYINWKDDDLKQAMDALAENPIGFGHAEYVTGTLLRESWAWLTHINVPWDEIADSGWPLFSVISSLAERVRKLEPAEKHDEVCFNKRMLQRLNDSFKDGTSLPFTMAQELKDAPKHCTEARITGNFLMADLTRFQTGRVVRKINEQNSENSFYYRGSAMNPSSEVVYTKAEENDVGYFVEQGRLLFPRDSVSEKDAKKVVNANILRSPWQMFRVLDRVGCDQAVEVSSEETAVAEVSAPKKAENTELIVGSIVRVTRGHKINEQGSFSSVTGLPLDMEGLVGKIVWMRGTLVRVDFGEQDGFYDQYVPLGNLELVDAEPASSVKEVSAGGASQTKFWMHVFPHRVSSDGLISNKIRATKQPYCHKYFMQEAKSIMSHGPPGKLQFVELGPHFGDCMLWAAAYFGQKANMFAVEPIHQVVSLFRQSILSNKFEDRIQVKLGRAGDVDRESSHSNLIPTYRVDSLVDYKVDILKIHTNGNEDKILRGASKLLDGSWKIPSIIIHSADSQVLFNCADQLLSHGYSVEVEGKNMNSTDTRNWLQELQSSGGGGMQMVSRHAPSLQKRLSATDSGASGFCQV